MVEPAGFPPSDLDFPKHHHDQTLNAVSFGFIATAVLFAMFLVVAIFERVLRPHRALQSRGPTDEELQAELPPEPSDSQKPELRHVSSYSKSVSVLMPGQEYPTYFAKLILSPMAPEGVEWPSHGESSQHDPTLERTPSQKESVFGRTGSNLGEKGATSRKGGTTSN